MDARAFFALAMFFCTANLTFAMDAKEVKRTPFYEQTREQYALFHGRYDVVMFGDSLTERGHWQDLFPDVKIGNRGIGGDDTQGMLDRVSDVEKTGAKRVFIMAGTNDLSRRVPPEAIAKNIISIAKYFSARGINPVIESTILSGKDRIGKNPKINQINKLLRLEAQANGFVYLDINKVIAPSGYLPEDFTIDGTHLTAAGYNSWRWALQPFIN